MTLEDLLADPELAVLSALAVDRRGAPVVLDAPPASFAERLAELARWLDPTERPAPVPSSLTAADLVRAERAPGWERSSFLDRSRGRVLACASPEALEPAARALLWRASGVRVVAGLRRRGAPPPPWPALFPRSSESRDPVAVLRARLGRPAAATSADPHAEPRHGGSRFDAGAARARIAAVEVEPGVWPALAAEAASLEPGALGEGDAALHRAVRLLVAWAAILGRPAVAAADVSRLGDVFGRREPSPERRAPETSSPAEPPPGETSLEDRIEADEVALAHHVAPVAGAGRRAAGAAGRRGRIVRHARADSRRAPIDVAATIRRALPFQSLRGREPGQPPRIVADDLRTAVRRTRQGAVHYVVLDASGSMGGERIRIGRGAALALLEEAYRTRESVGLVVVAGGRARLVAAPMRAPERLRRLVLSERTRGGTPLPAALALVLDRVRRGRAPASVALVTDGRANVSISGERDAERAGRETARLIAALSALGARPAVLARASDRQAAAFAEHHGLELVRVHPLDPRRRR